LENRGGIEPKEMGGPSTAKDSGGSLIKLGPGQTVETEDNEINGLHDYFKLCKIGVVYFHELTKSFAHEKKPFLLFSSSSELFCKNTAGGGCIIFLPS
jgi:hypothetical protein